MWITHGINDEVKRSLDWEPRINVCGPLWRRGADTRSFPRPLSSLLVFVFLFQPHLFIFFFFLFFIHVWCIYIHIRAFFLLLLLLLLLRFFLDCLNWPPLSAISLTLVCILWTMNLSLFNSHIIIYELMCTKLLWDILYLINFNFFDQLGSLPTFTLSFSC